MHNFKITTDFNSAVSLRTFLYGNQNNKFDLEMLVIEYIPFFFAIKKN